MKLVIIPPIIEVNSIFENFEFYLRVNSDAGAWNDRLIIAFDGDVDVAGVF
jgi:hypothetical protein